MASRNTWALRGGCAGPRNAGDCDTSMCDGTVRPVPAMIRWPSGAHRELQEPPRRVLVLRAAGHAVRVGVQDAGRLAVGRQRRDVPVERRDRPERGGDPARGHAAWRAGRWRSGTRRPRPRPPRRSGTTPYARRRSTKFFSASRASGVSRVNRVGRRRVVDDLAAVGPDERREPDHRRLDAEPVDGDPAGAALGLGARTTWRRSRRGSARWPSATRSFQVQPGLRLGDAVLAGTGRGCSRRRGWRRSAAGRAARRRQRKASIAVG